MVVSVTSEVMVSEMAMCLERFWRSSDGSCWVPTWKRLFGGVAFMVCSSEEQAVRRFAFEGVASWRRLRIVDQGV